MPGSLNTIKFDSGISCVSSVLDAVVADSLMVAVTPIDVFWAHPVGLRAAWGCDCLCFPFACFPCVTPPLILVGLLRGGLNTGRHLFVYHQAPYLIRVPRRRRFSVEIMGRP